MTIATTAQAAAVNPRATLQDWLPKLVLAPSFALILLFVYGFIIFTAVLSFTNSKLLPDFSAWVGFNNYVRLFNHPNWITSLKNLAIFSSLYIVICSGAGAGPRHPAGPEDPRRRRA
jgi:glucose/mannose transport system permease protein